MTMYHFVNVYSQYSSVNPVEKIGKLNPDRLKEENLCAFLHWAPSSVKAKPKLEPRSFWPHTHMALSTHRCLFVCLLCFLGQILPAVLTSILAILKELLDLNLFLHLPPLYILRSQDPATSVTVGTIRVACIYVLQLPPMRQDCRSLCSFLGSGIPGQTTKFSWLHSPLPDPDAESSRALHWEDTFIKLCIFSKAWILTMNKLVQPSCCSHLSDLISSFQYF